MVLVGVMVDSADPPRSACLIRCTYPSTRRSASHLAVGANACDLAEVRQIREDAVVLRNLLTNQLEILPLQPSPISPAAPPGVMPPPAPAVVQASPDLVSVDLPKASVDHYLLNLTELLSSARATPRFRDSGSGQLAMAGFELDQIKPGSVVEQLGLKNGDVIVEVNGERLDSLATIMRLSGQARTVARSTLTVLRGTQRMTFVFTAR
jgi:type II secretory pathway component PulC